MKRNILLILFALIGPRIVLAQAPIDFDQTVFIKRLNMSPAFPIDLFRSTHPQHVGRHFAARTIAHLEVDGLSDQDKKAVRNEICASDTIYQNPALAADNLSISRKPGSWGVYLKDGAIVSLSDPGISGDRLTTLFRTLSNAAPDLKAAWAKYYAVAMTKNLQNIHTAGIIWNNVDLRNFYARADGGTYAVDFSDARKPPPADLQAAKNSEFATFANTTLREMYRQLFPDRNEGYERYANLLAIGAVSAVLGKLPGMPAVGVGGNGANGIIAAANLQTTFPGLSAADEAVAKAAAAAQFAVGDVKEPIIAAAAKAIVRTQRARTALMADPAVAAGHAAGHAQLHAALQIAGVFERLLPGITTPEADLARAVVANAAGAAQTLDDILAVATRNTVNLNLPASNASKILLNKSALTEADVILSLNAALPGARNSGNILTAGLSVDGIAAADYATHSDDFLFTFPAYWPQRGTVYTPVLSGDQAHGGANHMYVEPDVLEGLLPLPGVAAPPPLPTKAQVCAGWTGDE